MDLLPFQCSVATCGSWLEYGAAQIFVFSLSYLSNLLGNSDDLYGVVEGSGNLELTPLSGIFPLSI